MVDQCARARVQFLSVQRDEQTRIASLKRAERRAELGAWKRRIDSLAASVRERLREERCVNPPELVTLRLMKLAESLSGVPLSVDWSSDLFSRYQQYHCL